MMRNELIKRSNEFANKCKHKHVITEEETSDDGNLKYILTHCKDCNKNVKCVLVSYDPVKGTHKREVLYIRYGYKSHF